MALEATCKHLCSVLAPSKPARLDDWLLTDVLGLHEELQAEDLQAIKEELSKSRKGEPGSLGLYEWSNETSPQLHKSLGEAVKGFGLVSTNSLSEADLYLWDDTPFQGGVLDPPPDCRRCLLGIRMPPTEIELCEEHSLEMYRSSLIYRLVICRKYPPKIHDSEWDWNFGEMEFDLYLQEDQELEFEPDHLLFAVTHYGLAGHTCSGFWLGRVKCTSCILYMYQLLRAVQQQTNRNPRKTKEMQRNE